MAAAKMTKNQMRRAKKKEQKKSKAEDPKHLEQSTAPEQDSTPDEPSTKSESLSVKDGGVTKTQVPADGLVDDELDDDPAFAMYKDVFSKFGADTEENEIAREANAGNQGSVFFNDDDDIPDEDGANEGQPKLSKKRESSSTSYLLLS
uniref:Uncharacterized protein n=1 Tax=Bionectria ochroleuca TaxID=29856 RepID=A0A8H7K9C5_BIOOC